LQEYNEQRYIQEDEIDLRELFQTIWAKKVFIAGFTILVTLMAGIYLFFKNPIPIYKGTLLVEIGEVLSNDFKRLYLDNPNDLAIVLENSQNVEVSIPKKTNNLIMLSSTSQDKQQISKNLNKAYRFILQRDEQKAKVFKNVIMTKQINNTTESVSPIVTSTFMTKEIGGINIDDKPINTPKKKLIIVVTFVTGLILSIFLVFFWEFIKTFKEEEQKA